MSSGVDQNKNSLSHLFYSNLYLTNYNLSFILYFLF